MLPLSFFGVNDIKNLETMMAETYALAETSGWGTRYECEYL